MTRMHGDNISDEEEEDEEWARDKDNYCPLLKQIPNLGRYATSNEDKELR